MKAQWMLLPMLQLVLSGADAQPMPAPPTWTVDPAVPGPDLPPAGTSLFDRITTDADGQQQIVFPFERLIERIEASAGCGATQPCTRAVLIPLGRSLQRLAASPDFYRHPRIVAAVAGEGSGLMLRDRLYLGYQDRTGVLEVISYNETLGRFEFQIVSDYAAGRAPTVTYARRTVCVACHQNHGPLFSQQLWLETNANPRIAQWLIQERATFSGVAARIPTDVTQAIDDATDRSMQLSLLRRLWSEGCGVGVRGEACRRTAIIAALRLALSGGRGYASNDADFERDVAATLTAQARARWSHGLAVPDADLPNRDPLDVAVGTTGAQLANVTASVDPLVPRQPREVLAPDGAVLADRLVKALAATWSAHRLQALDVWMRARRTHSGVRVVKAPCRIDQTRFECATAESLRIAGSLASGSIDEIRTGPSVPIRYLSIGSLRRSGRNRADFDALDGERTARLPDGNAIEHVALEWSDGTAPARGNVSVTIRSDFDSVTEAVAGLNVATDAQLPGLIEELLAQLKGTPSPAQLVAPPAAKADVYAAVAADDRPITRLFESRCGSCHHTALSTPPNFLAGDAARVEAALQSCSQRIFVRLAMRGLPPDQRAKSPMPPQRLHASHNAADDKAAIELLATVESQLTQRDGRTPTLEDALRHGYESLPPCLPSPE
jgi:cytochrome c5